MHKSISRTLSTVFRRLQSPAVRDVCLGSLAASHAVLWWTWFAAAWGMTPSVVIALVLSFGAASLFGRRLAIVDVPGLRWGAHVLLAGWTLALPGFLALSPELLQWLPLNVLQRSFVPFSVTLIAALLLIAPGWIILLQTVSPARENEGSCRPAAPWTLLGAAAATLLIPMTLAVHFDLQQISWTVSGIALLVAGVTWVLHHRRVPSAPADCGDRPSTSGLPVSVTWRDASGDLWLALLAGIGVAVATRVTGQLIAQAAYVTCSQIAGLLAGIGVGIALRRRSPSGTTVSAPVVESLIVAWSVALLVVLYPQLMTAAFRISAGVSHTLGIFLLRGGLLCAALAPLGVALGLRLGEESAERNGKSRYALIPAFAAAFAGARAIDAPVALCLAVVIAATCAVVAFRLWSVRPNPGIGRRAALATACVAPLIASLFFTSRFDANRSAKVLFSTQSFQAFRGGTPMDQLHQIDDGRLIDSFQRDGSTWTAWLHAGHQVLVRENGVPRGVSSLNTGTCPQVPTEVLPAVLPLVIHPSPRSVTLVGVGGSATLSACLAFPVTEVNCVEPHAGLLAVAERCGDASASPAPDPFEDSRLRVIRAEPVLAAAARQQPQDVIILNRGQAALWDAAAEFTTEYYRRLAEHLAPGGLLVQRLYYGDFGAQPVRDVAATLRDVFPQVILIETGPGELVFLASRGADPIVGSDVLHRAARPHVRALLSQLGWDWSVLLTMATLTSASVDEIADPGPSQANTMVSGRFTFQLPVEVARWDAKQQEIQDLLGPHSTRLFALIDNETGVQELVLRLADVAERQRIIENHPDVYWAYRDSLRSRLQERPRMTIQQVAHEGLARALHPEDERRKEFLLALNAAATQSRPDADALNRLERYAEPYDPLVSYFVHHELAHLYARAESPNPRAELAHRLHSVYFGSARDQSVRNVAEAIELVIEQPEVLPDARQRWDSLNALLEVLMRRWQLRSNAGGEFQYEAADVNSSLDAAQHALRTMDELAAGTAVSSADWRIRRGLLEQHLIRPLRNRRSGQRT